MSGSNLFSELALALRRTISPIRKPDSSPSLDKSKSQPKGAIHKMKQIVPQQVWSNKSKDQSLVIDENVKTDFLDADEEKKESRDPPNESFTASVLINRNTDKNSDRCPDSSTCPFTNADVLPDQLYREEVLTCTIRKAVTQGPLEKVGIMYFDNLIYIRYF